METINLALVAEAVGQARDSLGRVIGMAVTNADYPTAAFLRDLKDHLDNSLKWAVKRQRKRDRFYEAIGLTEDDNGHGRPEAHTGD